MKFGYDTSGLRIDQAIEELARRTLAGVTDACLMIEADAVENYIEGKARNKKKRENSDAEDESEIGDSDAISLAQSISSRVDVNGAKVVGTVGSGLEFAVYVHEGTGKEAPLGRKHDLPWSYQDEMGQWHTTSGMKPNPFLEKAFDENRSRAKQIVREAIFGK